MLAQQIPQYIVSGLTSGSIYALVALGFCLIHNATRIVNFAQGEFVMLGALATVSLVADLGLPLWFGAAVSVAMVTLVGVFLDRGLIRRARTTAPIVFIMITVGASIALQGTGMIIWGKDARTLPPIGGYRYIRFGSASIIPQTLVIIGVVACLLLGLYLFLHRHRIGRAIRAVADNPEGALLVGIPVGRLVALSFGMSGALGALAGILVTPLTTMSYQSGLMLGLKGFSAAVLGGFGSLPGAVAGGFILGMLEAFGSGLLSSTYKDAIAFMVLVMILFCKPDGLFGSVRLRRA
ncbi:branched-chain amino acid ABC transporter permease [Thermodesulforhabdus norvegica]|uniref:Amino acid/amide ABC transporter membrane protein 1, HAAT family n=1 Tax=Thermodesulforhabdus norvegica TaxID=39841 RepID=A0A1I4TZ28_9BACT|nr:branched-chain amino acid ABC transporter permease [Thermodesulforhabdus norvegica]SFM82002.1 amino acid/amide ABC transporter membrane protein 1, HAAT family [Thermodesulforhabdus norvegica]